MQKSPRILSIQSHVVSGYCGNKSATFPLQLLEFEVDVVNSVQLSNHTQYKVTKGQIFRANDLKELHRGLKENNLIGLYDIILSGYVADVGYIEAMAQLIRDVKEERAKLNLGCFYALDPVLGDDGVGYYVPDGVDVGQAYKTHLLPLADMITPNRFEASILSGKEIDPESSQATAMALSAMKEFHDKMNVPIVCITSLEVASQRGQLSCIVSREKSYRADSQHLKLSLDEPKTLKAATELESWIIQVPKLNCPFTGTGDLFTALISAWLHKTNFDLKVSLENTANTIHDVLIDTFGWFHYVNDGSVQSHELRLVQNRDRIVTPSNGHLAVQIPSPLQVTSLSNPTKVCPEKRDSTELA